ncbi:N-alpha-acetyltransferase, non-catalitic subunit [Kickxella alabastrina]|uniref:N-alpha-acetyltransferase, non-catalitic subunit n=1 Tax=Kickxella alabastrina TaxID=61397 RepID=A0ACC1IT53_9FUNG|nr:N-alpha-acetyltransferase, non-catalitic subunit [Kickxella alabastrina]
MSIPQTTTIDSTTQPQHFEQSNSHEAVISDSNGDTWLDISSLMTQATKELHVGELLKPSSLTLFDAMTSVEVMDPRLDMGMLTLEDEAEINQWDINRRLTLADVRWIAERLFCCEMTWHNSASLLQTLYTCNYFTVRDLPPRQPGMEPRDLVLFPLVIATAACCRRVWAEYARENVFAEEDVYFGGVPVEFFDHVTLAQASKMLTDASTYLADASASNVGGEGDAAALLLEMVEIRTLWLRALVYLSADHLSDDPGALDKGSGLLGQLVRQHSEHIAADQGRSNGVGDVAMAPVPVPGCFDRKCMRKYPTLAPVKPRPLLSLAESHSLFAQLIRDLRLITPLVRCQSVERLMRVFTGVAHRQPPPLPFARSLFVSVLAADNRVLLGQPLVAFVKRAVAELSGPQVWVLLARPTSDLLLDANDRVDAFCREAARSLLDWFRALCQNAPRQRRIATKCAASWDALQGDAEQLDIDLFQALRLGKPELAEDPRCNPFWFSSWAYHMKLLLIEAALMSGFRLDVYLAHELPCVLAYAAQVFEAHHAHLVRMAQMLGRDNGGPGTAACASAGAGPAQWTLRAVPEAECRAQIGRWTQLVLAQKHLSTALWLVAHALERLGVVRAPWILRHRRVVSPEALETWRRLEAEEAQAVRFTLRFRAFSRLNSPTALSFTGWVAMAAQLDECPVGELFSHAVSMLGEALKALNAKCFSTGGNADNGNGNGNGGAGAGADADADADENQDRVGLRLAAERNLGALALVIKMRSPALCVTGAQALGYRNHLLAVVDKPEAEEATTRPEDKDEAEEELTPKSKSKAKRDRKKRSAARQEALLTKQARQWQAAADALPLDASWACSSDRYAIDWPQFRLWKREPGN